MNSYFITAASISTIMCLVHLIYGRQHYLTPMLTANFDLVAGTMMRCIFHFLSIFMLLSTAMLFICGFGLIAEAQSYGVIVFIALNFGLFAIWQIYIVFVCELPTPFSHLFQWLFFSMISIICLLGLLMR